MMKFSNIIYLVCLFTISSCTINSIENEDGSYSIGHNSDSRGETANSVLALLSKSGGYTIDRDYESQQYSEPEPELELEPEMIQEAINIPIESRVLSPHLEILQLVETFLRFKGELGSRLYALINDNYDLIHSVYLTIINKIGTLHHFTLTGILILRKLLEVAVSLMAQWQIHLPGLDLGINVGGQGSAQGSSSFSINKSGNFFSGR